MSDEYSEISSDWRHRDNLTWQIPSLLSAIAGGLIVAAYGIEVPEHRSAIRLILLGIAGGLSFCLTVALAQNLVYQACSGAALERLRQGRDIPREKLSRSIRRTDLCLSRREILRRLVTKLTGSTMLFILCVAITVCVAFLFQDAWRAGPSINFEVQQ